MITEIDAGHIVYDGFAFMGLERRLKGHLVKGEIDGEEPLTTERIPDEGMIIIIPKKRSADKTYFNDGAVEVNIIVPDLDGETNPQLNGLLRKALDGLKHGIVDVSDGTWYRYSVRSHGIEAESSLKCHYANITLDFETLNVGGNL